MQARIKLKFKIFRLYIFFLQLIVILSFSLCGVIIKSKSLPEFHIKADSSELNFYDYSESKISFYKRRKTITFNENPAKIKYRGNSSGHHEKKCFSLKFEDEKCFENMNCHKRWKLNAEYIDKTFMRNKLSYDLFRLFSVNNFSPQISYVILYLNNDYRGIYTLTERVDENRLKINKKDPNSALFKDPPISNKPEEHPKNYENYVKFCNWAEGYKNFSEKAKKKLLMEAYYNQRYPDIDKENRKHLIHQLTEFIINSSDEDFSNKAKFNTFLNLENIIDWHLLLLLTNNHDGIVKNYYLYKQGTVHPYEICPWDYDCSFGRDGDGEINLDSFIDLDRIFLISRLLETNAFNYKKKLYDKFMLLKNENILTSKSINKMIDKNVKQIKPYIDENEKKWPLNNIHYFNGSSFQKEIILMKNWINIRLGKVENYLFEMNNSPPLSVEKNKNRS